MEGELNRASLFFRYIREENEHHKTLFEKGKREMLESLKHVRVDPSAAPANQTSSSHVPPRSHPDSNRSEEDENKTLDSDIRRIYRKIALETHPDKTEKLGLSLKEIEKRDKAYKKATAAAAALDSDTLIEIAVDLEIDTGLDEPLIAASLRRRAKVLEDEISSIKRTVEWFWIHAPDEKKIDIIKEICKRNGWIYVTDEQIENAVRFVVGAHPGSREDIRRRAREIVQKRQQENLKKEGTNS